MQELTCAADVVLARLLDAPPRAARVVVATPLAAYASCGDVLLGVLAPSAVRVPGSLVVPPRLVGVLRPGDELLIGGSSIVVAGVRLAVRRWWDSAVPRMRPVPGPPVILPPSRAVPDAVGSGALLLAEALGGAGGVGEAVRSLVGLGPGLTPAGDDVVAGALLALVAAGDLGRAGAVFGAVQPCRHRTTALSAALLDHAAAGRAVPQLASHLRAPADPDALARLLAVGGSSGTALALGAALGLSAAAATMASPGAREAA